MDIKNNYKMLLKIMFAISVLPSIYSLNITSGVFPFNTLHIPQFSQSDLHAYFFFIYSSLCSLVEFLIDGAVIFLSPALLKNAEPYQFSPTKVPHEIHIKYFSYIINLKNYVLTYSFNYKNNVLISLQS